MSAYGLSVETNEPDASAGVRHPGSVRRARTVAATEIRKQLAQAAPRVLAAICVVGPFAFAALLRVQNSTPADSLFGTWTHQSGGAVSLVVLSFAANWGFPLIAGILGGDLFSAEDRHGTWKTLLTRSRSLRDVFAGKVLAAALLTLGLAVCIAAASVIAGLTVIGSGSLVNLGGQTVGGAHLLWLVAVAWASCLVPLLAYLSLAVLFSVVTRSGIVGVLAPLVIGLLTQLLALIGKGVVVHLLLVGSAFDGWHGLFEPHPFAAPLIVSLVVCMIWIAGSLWVAWIILRRREFIAGSPRHRSVWTVPARTVGVAVPLVALLAVASGWGPAGVTSKRLSTSFKPEFRRLLVLQQNLLGHPIPVGSHYRILPVCNKRGAAPVGPGDWSCTINVYVALPNGQQPLTDTPVGYDVSVQSNGCYKASSPPNYVGSQTIREKDRRRTVNPLVTIYGCFNIL